MTVVGWLILLVAWSVLSLVGLAASLVLTNPLTLGPMGVTLWFIVAYLASSAVVTLAMYTAKTFLHVHTAGVARLRYSRRQGLLIGAWLTGMLALSSLHQLGPLDAILLALLLVIVEVYVRFRWP
ncbi:MAG: hypothetical protein JWN01_869 [Patescibacteria group bacterium]|nr:hypothetical protein [Patescibacteria group bacterium]